MVKKLGLFLLLLFLLPSAYAITFFVDSEATLWGSCKNVTYADSTAKITLRYPNGSLLISNDSMTIVSQGQFNYTFITPNQTGNYLSQIECNIGGVVGYDEDDFWVRDKEEEMTSTAVVGFLMLFIIGLFSVPFFIHRFVENKYLLSTFKGLSIILGLMFTSLGTAIVSTVADKAKLGITSELFTILFIVNWAAYISMVVVVLGFGYQMLQMWKIDKQNRRDGIDDGE